MVKTKKQLAVYTLKINMSTMIKVSQFAVVAEACTVCVRGRTREQEQEREGRGRGGERGERGRGKEREYIVLYLPAVRDNVMARSASPTIHTGRVTG